MCPFTTDVMQLNNTLLAAKNLEKYSQNQSPTLVDNRIVLSYPGKKNGGVDYLLRLNEKIVYHSHIAEVFYNLGEQGLGEAAANFITNFYNDGLNADHITNLPETVRLLDEDLTFEQFKHLIYYTILQEDINYPRPRYFGLCMPLIRFTEAIIAGEQNNIITFQEVVNRINNHGGPPPRAINHPALNTHFIETFNTLNNR